MIVGPFYPTLAVELPIEDSTTQMADLKADALAVGRDLALMRGLMILSETVKVLHEDRVVRVEIMTEVYDYDPVP